MNTIDCVFAAFESLRANILRTVLTTLGIIIGVAAVIAMVAVGAGAEHRVQAVIQSLGSNILIVLNGSGHSGGARGGTGSAISLTEEDAASIEREIPSVQIAAPNIRGSAQVIFGKANWFTIIRGCNQNYLDARDWEIESGRGFAPGEERAASKVAVIGQTVVDRLFDGQNPIGQSIRVKRVPFTIIGVTRSKGQTPFGRDQDDIVFIPLATAKKRVLGGARIRGPFVGSIMVKAWSADETVEAEQQVKELLRRRHRLRAGHPDDFFVRNISQILEARAESQRVMSFLLAAVAAVSLLVGGIGIMNIMLVSVTERTREIGLRMAVGAKAPDVMLQFIIEAVVLSLIGGLIGISVGIGGSMLAANLGSWPLIISPGAILIAILVSAVVGVFFGFYPARKAARLNPIDALRYE